MGHFILSLHVKDGACPILFTQCFYCRGFDITAIKRNSENLQLIQWMFLEKMRHCSSFLMVRNLNNTHSTNLTVFLVKQLLLLARSIVIMGSDVFSNFFSCFMYVTISYYLFGNNITLKSGYYPGICYYEMIMLYEQHR